jgi:acetylornithine deacetylase/succinyl-diaminopimelate desuccinylase-like protein
MNKRHLWILLFAATCTLSVTFAQMPIADELYAYVLGIEGRTHLERGEFIKDQLHKMGAGYVTAPFKKVIVQRNDTLIIEGENIIARIGNGSKRIIVGAHYDAFSDSPGANDNGSGIAVVLALINHLESVDWNYSVDLCFFDQEEPGSVGSFYYIKQFVIPKLHLAMINIDTEGSGEEVYVGPVGNNNKMVMRYVREAAQRTGFPLVEHTDFPGSDHESFTKFYLENIAISIVPKGDSDKLSKYVNNGYKVDSADAPKVLSVMHTVDDRSNLISPESLKMSYEFTKTLLMLLNDSRK